MEESPIQTMPGGVQSRVLEADEATRYVRRFQKIIRAARLNSQYPDSRRLGGHVGAMGGDVHGGLYESLQLNASSGLPTYREWTRVQTDVTIAADQLRQLGARVQLATRAERAAPDSIHHKQLAKHDYYQSIQALPLAPLGDMQVLLRRIEPDQRRAHFHVIFDKLDVSGLFVRYTLDLAQEHSAWGRPAVVLDEETAAYTEDFKSLIYRFSSFDAEFTFAKLTALAGVSVERVIKGTVGPFYFADSSVPEPLDTLLGAADGADSDAFVAMFALDTAARDVTENRNNDPFGSLFDTGVSAEVRHTYSRARDAYGYRVFKDRKFVVSAPHIEPLRDLCRQMGTQNIVYAI
ncbi:MAG: hypothetical protein ACNA8W_06950 [Bradymonadaceae bacterium]